jgi:hypothetical protein
MIFKLKTHQKAQLLQYDAPSASYVPLQHPRSLTARLFTLFLPSAVALEVYNLAWRLSSLDINLWAYISHSV